MERALLAGAALAVAAASAVALLAGGLEGFSAPLSSRILYVHVPAAWAAYAAFAAAAAASLAVLARRPGGDALALACVEAGALFGAVALATGVLWARVEFGGDYALARDPKLVTTLVLELAYLGYLALRRAVDEPERRARLAAVYALLALVTVPLSYLANLAATPHPDFAQTTELTAGAGGLLLLAVAAYTALGAALVRVRWRLARAESRVEARREAMSRG